MAQQEFQFIPKLFRLVDVGAFGKPSHPQALRGIVKLEVCPVATEPVKGNRNAEALYNSFKTLLMMVKALEWPKNVLYDMLSK